MIQATFHPLVWLGPMTPPHRRRPRGTFTAAWSNTLQLLERELHHLKAQHVIIEADFVDSDIRLDGMPRANARYPDFPGVRVVFESTHGRLAYQTDSCAFWQHNVRSIALGLEALRAVDRYGITAKSEQYTGFQAITAASAEGPDKAEAQHLLASYGGLKQALKTTHPDRGGSADDFHKVQEAKHALGL